MLKVATLLFASVGVYGQTTPDPLAGCWDLGVPQETNNADDHSINYVNTVISTFNLPLAIGHCTAADLVGAGGVMYECEDDDTLIKRLYTDQDCNLLDEETYLYSNDTTNPSEAGYFVCDGTDEYIAARIIPDAVGDCETAEATGAWRTLVAAVSSCSGNDNSDINAYCQVDYGRIQFFAPETQCIDPYQCRGNFTNRGVSNCAAWFDTDLGTIYGYMTECETLEYTNTDTPSADDDDSSATMVNVAFASFAALVVAMFY